MKADRPTRSPLFRVFFLVAALVLSSIGIAGCAGEDARVLAIKKSLDTYLLAHPDVYQIVVDDYAEQLKDLPTDADSSLKLKAKVADVSALSFDSLFPEGKLVIDGSAGVR